MSDLIQPFEAAAEEAKQLPSRPSDRDLLSLYAHYKQATEGDVSGSRPSLFDFKNAAKYGAWEELKGMATEDAMSAYIALVDRLKNG